MRSRLIFLTAMLALISASVSAQNYQRNILGVRAGLKASSLRTENLWTGAAADGSRMAKMGWHLGVTDQILLTRSIPLYFEVGVSLSNKGAGIKERVNSTRYKQRYGITFLQIPFRVNYHFDAGDFTIEPFFGFYYAAGLWGRYVDVIRGGDSGNTRLVRRLDFKNDLSRSDFGIALGVGGTYGHYYTSFGWERGVVNMSRIDGQKYINNGSFTLTVGYNF